jgi:hypothetical protein
MLERSEIGLRLGWKLVYFSTINLVLFINMVNAFYFLLLQITKIYKAMSIRVGPTQRRVKSILKVNVIDICHITMVESFVSETALNPILLFSWYPFFIQTFIDCISHKEDRQVYASCGNKSS